MPFLIFYVILLLTPIFVLLYTVYSMLEVAAIPDSPSFSDDSRHLSFDQKMYLYPSPRKTAEDGILTFHLAYIIMHMYIPCTRFSFSLFFSDYLLGMIPDFFFFSLFPLSSLLHFWQLWCTAESISIKVLFVMMKSQFPSCDISSPLPFFAK